MAHSIANEMVANVIATFQLTVSSYTAGTGESFTLAELKLSPGTTVIPVINPSSRNSLSVMLFPVYASGVLKLFQFVSGAPQEVATNASLNAIFDVALLASGQQLNAF